MENIIERIKKEKGFVFSDKINKLLVVDVYNKKKYEYIKKYKRLRGYTCNNENVFAYDIMDENDKISIPIYFIEKEDDDDSKSEYPIIIFGNKI